MTNMPYEERIKNRDNDWYYNKCIRQYHFIIKSEGANQRYKEEIKQLTKAKETTENEYGDLLKAFAKSETENKKEIARLNKIIDEIEKIVFDKSLHETDYEGIFKCIDGKIYMCKRYYLLTELRKKIRKLKKGLKEEGKKDE